MQTELKMKNHYIKFHYTDSRIREISLNVTEVEAADGYDAYYSEKLNIKPCGNAGGDGSFLGIIKNSAGVIYETNDYFQIELLVYNAIPQRQLPFEDILALSAFMEMPSPFLVYNLPPTKSFIVSLYEKIAQNIINENHRAKSESKNLLVLVGDVHGAYDSFLINLLSLKAAAAHGVQNFIMEVPDASWLYRLNHNHILYLQKFAVDKLNMNIKYGDPKHHEADELNRNLAMNDKVAEISKKNDAIYIVGADHIRQLLASEEIKSSARLFTILTERYVQLEVFPCEINDTLTLAGEHSLVATIVGNPFYLESEEMYDLVSGL